MRFIDPLSSCGFASGAMSYRDHAPGRTFPSQIVLPVKLANQIVITAIVDTGSTWCIVDPEIIALLGKAVEETYDPGELIIRGVRYQGRLVRLSMRLQAEQGSDLEIEATVFAPNLQQDQAEALPNFIGLEGFLQRVRFAIDPSENTFYFGQV